MASKDKALLIIEDALAGYKRERKNHLKINKNWGNYITEFQSLHFLK